jgi:hypothetical protein
MATESQAQARAKARGRSVESPFTLAWLRPSGGSGPVFGLRHGAAWVALALAALTWSGATLAAEPEMPAISLAWLASPGCPERAAVLGRVRSLLGPSPPAAEPIAATGLVTATPGGFTLAFELTQRGETHSRTLTAPTCEELSDAGALIVALAVNPALVIPAPGDTPAGAPPGDETPKGLADPPPLPAAQPEPERESAAAPRPAPPPATTDAEATFRLRSAFVAALGDLGSLPRAAAGARAGLELASDSVALDVLVDFLPPARRTIAESPERGGDVMLLAGGLRACATPFGPSIAGCAGFEAGFLDAESFGASVSNDGGLAGWFAGRVGLGGRLPLDETFALRADAEALVPVSTPKFVMTGLGTVYRPWPVEGRLGLGVEVTFFRRKR